MNKLKRAGYCLLIIVLLNLIAHLVLWNQWDQILWFCDLAAIILALGLITQQKELVGGVLVAATGAQFLWIIDFFLYVFHQGMGRTEVLFSASPWWLATLSVIMHGVVIPLALIACWKRGYASFSFFSCFLLFILFLFPVTFMLTPIQENTNCVFYDCDLGYKEDRAHIDQDPLVGTWERVVHIMINWTVIAFCIHAFYFFLFRKIHPTPSADG